MIFVDQEGIHLQYSVKKERGTLFWVVAIYLVSLAKGVVRVVNHASKKKNGAFQQQKKSQRIFQFTYPLVNDHIAMAGME